MREQLIQYVLERGLKDWIPLVDVVKEVRRSADVDDESYVRTETLALLADLADAGLVRIGEISDGGFFEFSVELNDVLDQVGRALRSKKEPDWWFVCWLENTEKGDSRSREGRLE